MRKSSFLVGRAEQLACAVELIRLSRCMHTIYRYLGWNRVTIAHMHTRVGLSLHAGRKRSIRRREYWYEDQTNRVFWGAGVGSPVEVCTHETNRLPAKYRQSKQTLQRENHKPQPLLFGRFAVLVTGTPGRADACARSVNLPTKRFPPPDIMHIVMNYVICFVTFLLWVINPADPPSLHTETCVHYLTEQMGCTHTFMYKDRPHRDLKVRQLG